VSEIKVLARNQAQAYPSARPDVEGNTMAVKHLVRAQAALKRIGWGAQEVGLTRILAGLVRLAFIVASRTPKAEVKTAESELRISFACPTQLMPLLVVFQELIEPELDAVRRLLGPGKVAVDVGASIGTWTLWAAKTGAIVHACEPDSENLAMLKENVRSNDLDPNVVAHGCAIGADGGWSVGPAQAGGYGINYKLASSTQQARGARICTLDRFADDNGLPLIDVLKVNTAGCEADVVLGSGELFRQQRIGVAFFLDGLAVRSRLDELKQFSYELGFYDGRKREFVPVGSSAELDSLRPGPANRYVLVKHSSIALPASRLEARM
jgi:FkbM family methyltransferase